MTTEIVERHCPPKTLCVDCKDPDCSCAGEKYADCPKYHCDNAYDCDNCDFINEFIDEMRKEYEK